VTVLGEFSSVQLVLQCNISTPHLMIILLTMGLIFKESEDFHKFLPFLT